MDIKEICEKHGKSITEVSKELFGNHNRIGMLFRKNPTLSTLTKVAKALGISTPKLVELIELKENTMRTELIEKYSFDEENDVLYGFENLQQAKEAAALLGVDVDFVPVVRNDHTGEVIVEPNWNTDNLLSWLRPYDFLGESCFFYDSAKDRAIYEGLCRDMEFEPDDEVYARILAMRDDQIVVVDGDGKFLEYTDEFVVNTRSKYACEASEIYDTGRYTILLGLYI